MSSPPATNKEERELLKKMSPTPMILVMGITGTGKSSFINKLPITTKKRAEVGHGFGSCTSECESLIAKIDGTPVWMVDTPGFDDNNEGITDAVVLGKITRVLTGQFQETSIQLKGIIYLQRISDIRIGGAGMRAFKILQEICGESAMSNVTLTTTRWGENPDKNDAERETFLQERAWSFILSKGARMQRYHNSTASALGIVREVLGNADVVLDIQEEIVNQGKSLSQTNAGAVVSGDLDALRAALETSLAEIQSLRQEISTSEADKIRLNREYLETTRQLEEAQAAKEILTTRMRDQIRAEIEEEIAKKNASVRKLNIAAKIVTTVVQVAAAIVSMLFGADPSFAADVEGMFN